MLVYGLYLMEVNRGGVLLAEVEEPEAVASKSFSNQRTSQQKLESITDVQAVFRLLQCQPLPMVIRLQ